MVSSSCGVGRRGGAAGMQRFIRSAQLRDELEQRKDEVQRLNSSVYKASAAPKCAAPNEDLLDEEMMLSLKKASLVKRTIFVRGTQVMDLTDVTYIEACHFSARCFPLMDGEPLFGGRAGSPAEWVNAGSLDGLADGAAMEDRIAAREAARAEFLGLGVVSEGHWQVRESGEWREVEAAESETLLQAYLNQQESMRVPYSVAGTNFEALPSLLRRRVVGTGACQDLRFTGVLPFDPVSDDVSPVKATSLPSLSGRRDPLRAAGWCVVIYYTASEAEKVEGFFEWAGRSLRGVEETEVEEPADDVEAYLQLLVASGSGARVVGRVRYNVLQGLAAAEASKDKTTVALSSSMVLQATTGMPDEVETVPFSTSSKLTFRPRVN